MATAAKSESKVPEALALLTLADVWELAPDGSAAPSGDGMVNSPLRQESSPSFSITGNMRQWKDFGNAGKRSGVWDFVAACRPEWSKGDIAKYLIAKAGLDDGKTQKLSKRQWMEEKKAAAALRVEKARRDRESALRGGSRMSDIPEWPDFVRSWFFDATPTDQQAESLAKRRGWPLDWVDDLINSELLRWPKLPWKDARYSALTVEVPMNSEWRTYPIGYHQRIWTADKGPDWLFVPWSPAGDGRDNPFIHACSCYATQMQVAPKQPLICPAPFVLGDPWTADVWCITEGQWDAITLWGAVGGFCDTGVDGIAVFGLRGSDSGRVAFLGLWGDLLRRHKPVVWMLPDRDKASGCWDGYMTQPDFSKPPPVYFVDQIRHATGGPVPVSRVPKSAGKDLNDWYRVDSSACTTAVLKKLALITQ